MLGTGPTGSVAGAAELLVVEHVRVEQGRVVLMASLSWRLVITLVMKSVFICSRKGRSSQALKGTMDRAVTQTVVG